MNSENNFSILISTNRKNLSLTPPTTISPNSTLLKILLKDIAALLYLFLILVFVMSTFQLHGISNDEEVQHRYGQLLIDFYRSGFSDTQAFSYLNLYLYGGLFDIIAAALEPISPWSVWDLRHLLSALFGVAGMVATWRLTKWLTNDATALAATTLLVLTGAWSGAIFTHTKDIPFASCMMWALYYTSRISTQLPKPTRANVVGFGVAIGLSFGLRVGAVFGLFYLVATMLVAACTAESSAFERLKFIANSTIRLLPGALIAVILMALLWPWSVMGPTNFISALTTFSHFTMDLHLKTLFNGDLLDVADTSSWYLPTYFALRLPEVLLLGLLFAALALVFNTRRYGHRANIEPDRLPCLPVLLAATFPLLAAIATAPALYNGIRHFLFLIPPMTVLAAIGFQWAWNHSGGIWRYGMLALAVALAADTAIRLVRLHPYQYVIYNRFAGDLASVQQRWELDYWSSSMREAAQWLTDYVQRHPELASKKLSVVVCAEPIQVAPYLGSGLQVIRDWGSADFYIFSTRTGCQNALRGPTIGRIERLGTVLTEVRDLRGVPRSLRRY